MRAHIMNVTKKLVRHRACFYADILVFDLLHQFWMHGKLKAMTNSFGAEKYGISKLSVLSRICFTCVQIELEAIAKLHFDGHYLFEEIVNARVVVLFINHIESGDQVGLCVGFDDGIKLRLDMLFTKDFQSANDQAHSEKREALLDLIDTVLKNGQFFSQRYCLAIIVKHAAHDVAVLNDGAHFIQEITSNSV